MNGCRNTSSPLPMTAPVGCRARRCTIAVSSASDSTTVKLVGAARRLTTASIEPASPAQADADHEGQDARAAEVDAGELGRDLVVADGPPLPADSAGERLRQQPQHDQRQRPAQVGQVGDAGGPLPVMSTMISREPVGHARRRHLQALLAAEQLLVVDREPGSPTASASVAPARYGPCSRAAAAPTSRPTRQVVTTEISTMSRNGSPSWRSSSTAVV